MKEKRYEIFKRGELEGRNPEGINAFCDSEADVNGNILENRSRYETCAPRSSLTNNMYNDLQNAKAKDPKPNTKKPGDPTSGTVRAQPLGNKKKNK